MKEKHCLLAAVAISILGAAWWIFAGSGPQADALPMVESAPAPAPAEPARPPGGTSGAAPEDKMAQVQAMMDAHKVPIVFWGKVEDTEGNPVEGVAVEFEAASPTNMGYGREEFLTSAVSDAGGKFRIDNIRAHTISLHRLTRSGYTQYSRQSRVFAYGKTAPEPHLPNEESPEVFVMRREGVTPRVTELDSAGLALRWDGVPVTLDLESMTLRADGKLKILAKREGPPVPPFVWSVTVSLEDGQVVEGRQISPAIAPETGYQETWRGGHTGKEERWNRGGTVWLYYKQGARYGRLDLTLNPGEKEGEPSLYLTRFTNEDGGRETEME